MKREDIMGWAEKLYSNNAKIHELRIVYYRPDELIYLRNNSDFIVHLLSQRNIIDNVIEGDVIQMPTIPDNKINNNLLNVITNYINENNEIFDLHIGFRKNQRYKGSFDCAIGLIERKR